MNMWLFIHLIIFIICNESVRPSSATFFSNVALHTKRLPTPVLGHCFTTYPWSGRTFTTYPGWGRSFTTYQACGRTFTTYPGSGRTFMTYLGRGAVYDIPGHCNTIMLIIKIYKDKAAYYMYCVNINTK